MCNNGGVPDVFVTLISVQPAVAVRSTAREKQQNHPQATGEVRAGIYDAKRQRQVTRGKKGKGA